MRHGGRPRMDLFLALYHQSSHAHLSSPSIWDTQNVWRLTCFIGSRCLATLIFGVGRHWYSESRFVMRIRCGRSNILDTDAGAIDVLADNSTVYWFGRGRRRLSTYPGGDPFVVRCKFLSDCIWIGIKDAVVHEYKSYDVGGGCPGHQKPRRSSHLSNCSPLL